MKIGLSKNFEYIYSKVKNKIIVYKNNKYIGELGNNIYNILLLINNKTQIDAEIALMKVFKFDLKSAKEVLKNIYESYEYILSDSNYYEYLEPYGTGDDIVNFNRLRSFVPKILVISLTRECFMKCAYCYAGAKYINGYSKDNISLKDINTILEQAVDIGINHVDLTGGDPFVREDIFEILDLIEKYNMTTNLSTKKYLNDFEIKRLSSYKCIDKLQVSIDSIFEKEEFKLLFEKNYVSTRLKMIEKLISNGLTIHTNSVLTKYNIDNIFKLIDKLNKIGVEKIVLSPYTNNLYNDKQYLFPDVKQYKDLSQKLKNSIYKNVEYPGFLENYSENISNKIRNGKCSACLDGLMISPKGNVCICERMAYEDKYSLGNIKDNSILEIWNSDNMKKYHLPNKENFKGTDCYNCERFNLCVNVRGLCYVHSKIINGTIYGPDNQCVKNKSERRIY